MITAFVFLIDGLILGYFTVKLIISQKKKYNPFMLFFVYVAGLFSLNFLTYTALIVYSVVTRQTSYLFWADYLGRFFVYLGSVFAIQIPLYRLFPKSKWRIIGSVMVAVLGVFLAVYNYLVPNQPFINSIQIVQWQSPAWLGLGLAVIVIGIWLPTSAIFLMEFMRSKMRQTRSLYLGSGFLIGSLGAAMQDFGTTVSSYLFINALLIIGYLLIFFGILLKSPEK